MADSPNRETVFKFKRFDVVNRLSAMKVGTDGVLLGAWADISGCKSALDVGAGTGLIALMLAQRGVCDIAAIEIDKESASEAEINVMRSPWNNRIKVVNSDFSDWIGEPVDLIVSNPPFFTEDIKAPDRSRATARHEGSLGVEMLIRSSCGLLNENGSLALIAPATRENDIICIAESAGLYVNRLTRVSGSQRKSPNRVLAQLYKLRTERCESELYIMDLTGRYSEEYRQLTSEFYLNF